MNKIKLFLGGNVVESVLLASLPSPTGSGMLIIRDGTFDGNHGIDICKVFQKRSVVEEYGDDVWSRNKGVWLTDEQARFLISELPDALQVWIDYLATA